MADRMSSHIHFHFWSISCMSETCPNAIFELHSVAAAAVRKLWTENELTRDCVYLKPPF